MGWGGLPMKAFELGASGVFLLSCEDNSCPYRNALDWTRLRLEAARKLITDAGLEPERLAMFSPTHATGQQLTGVVKEFAQQIKKLSNLSP